MSFLPKRRQQGFTLLELLIVIAIIAILASIVVIVLDPGEILKQARDTQRMSDLSTLKMAIGIYTTSVDPVYLSGFESNADCATTGNYKIFYSIPTDTKDFTASTVDDGDADVGQVDEDDMYKNTSYGWLPIEFSKIAGGSPISSLPVDPSNTVEGSTPEQSDLVYRYACDETAGGTLTYELNARLESTRYGYVSASQLGAAGKDGGDNDYLYEVGTNLNIMGLRQDF